MKKIILLIAIAYSFISYSDSSDLKQKAEDTLDTVKDLLDNPKLKKMGKDILENPELKKMGKDFISSLSDTKKEVLNKYTPYDRDDWYHWDSGRRGNKLNTRHELLESQSLVSVSYNKTRTQVTKGKWDDYYYPEVLTSPSKIDIDHIVPLKHANDHGGYSWSKDRKQEFANDTRNLVITLASYNRQKGDKSITEWLPVNRNYACRYVKRWFEVKEDYDLRIDADEIDTKRRVCGE